MKSTSRSAMKRWALNGVRDGTAKRPARTATITSMAAASAFFGERPPTLRLKSAKSTMKPRRPSNGPLYSPALPSTLCSNDTALRDIRDLAGRGILIRNEGGGRSTSYRLATSQELSA